MDKQERRIRVICAQLHLDLLDYSEADPWDWCIASPHEPNIGDRLANNRKVEGSLYLSLTDYRKYEKYKEEKAKEAAKEGGVK